MGVVASRMDGKQLCKRLLPAVIAALTTVAIAYHLEFLDTPMPRAGVEHFRGWLIGGTVILAASWGIGAWAARREQIMVAITAIALGTLAGLQGVMLDVDALAPDLSDIKVAEKAKPLLHAQTPLYSVGMYRQALPFYLRHSMILVDYQGELAFGIEQEPRRAIPDLNTFSGIWRQIPEALVVMAPTTFHALQKLQLPMEVVYEDPGIILVRKPIIEPEKIGSSTSIRARR